MKRLYELHSNIKSIVVFESPPLLFDEKNGRILAIGKGRTLLYKSGCKVEDLVKALTR